MIQACKLQIIKCQFAGKRWSWMPWRSKNCFQYNCDTNTYTISVHIFIQDFTPMKTILISQYGKLDLEYAGVVLYFTIVKNHQQWTRECNGNGLKNKMHKKYHVTC